MAYGLRLRIEYKDINDILSRINVYQDSYGGVADVRYAHAGIRVEWGDQGADGMPLVYGSSCTVFMDAEFDYEFLYLFNADARKHRIEMEKAGVVYWVGYNDPDSWGEPLIATPYPVQFTCYDGLGMLTESAFEYTGRATILQIFQDILAKTGLSLTLNTAVDYSSVGQPADTDPLAQHTYDRAALSGKNCYEVLEQFLQGCRILQRNAKWWIISNNNWRKNEFDYFSYGASAGTIEPLTTDFWMEGENNMEMLPAIKKMFVIQDFKYNANLIENGSFDDFDTDLNTFEGWTNDGVTPQQRVLNDDGDKYVLLTGNYYDSSLDFGAFANLEDRIYKEKEVKEALAPLKIALDYAVYGNGGGARVFIKVEVITAGADYYLRRWPWVGKEESWEWVEYPGGSVDGDDMIALASHPEFDKHDQFHYVHGVLVLAPYKNRWDNIPAAPIDKLTDSFRGFKATAPGIPADGTLRISLYIPITSNPIIVGSCFTALKLEFLDENEEKYPETRTFEILNNENNNYIPEDLNLQVGDYPEITNRKIIYSGGLQDLSGVETELWSVVGSASQYSYAEMIGRLIVSGQKAPRQSYQAKLADMIPGMTMVIVDTNNGQKKLVENGISYDDRFQRIEGRYTEVLDAYELLKDAGDPDETDLESGQFAPLEVTPVDRFAPVQSAASRVRTAKIPSKDECVVVYDANGSRVSAPAYMDGDYFEAYQGEDHITKIRPKPKTTVQVLTGTTPDLDVELGINATLTISGNTTITLSSLVAGTSGNLSVTNPATLYTLTVAGYTNKISAVAYLAANQLKVSGSSKLDIFSWYYDGTYLWWNGGQDYK